jgi:hypothetical protein
VAKYVQRRRAGIAAAARAEDGGVDGFVPQAKEPGDPDLQGRKYRRALDTTGAASLIRVADVELGGASRGDRAARGPRELQDTEVVYRRELRPVLTTGGGAMDRLFKTTPTDVALGF